MLPLVILLLRLTFAYTTALGCSLNNQDEVGFYWDGDVIIGGMIPVHMTWQESLNDFTSFPQPMTCNNFSVTMYSWVQAMVFAINEINEEQNLLPKISLGFLIYDTCLSARKAIEETLQMLTGQEKSIPNYLCKRHSPLTAVIGESSSTVSISIARLLGLHRYPQVSYFSTSSLLSDKIKYPSFFRTIPSDDIQARGLAQLVVHFGWTWVGLLYNEDDYGLLGSQILKAEFLKYNVCIAFHESIPLEPSRVRISLIAETVMRSRVNVIIAFCTAPYLILVMRALARHNITIKVWVASEGWSTSTRFSHMEFVNTMGDTIGLAVHEGSIPGFKDFLLKVHPENSLGDIFVKPFWERVFGCHWPIPESNLTRKAEELGEDFTVCTGEEKLERFKDKNQDEPDMRICYIIYNAVYAVAHALRSMHFCEPGQGPFIGNSCAKVSSFKPWQLLHYMKRVHFQNKNGEKVSFDTHGNQPALYDVINWQRGSDGAIQFIKTGLFNTVAPYGKELYVNDSALLWTKQGKEVPPSMCSESCLPGHRKAAQAGHPSCCFDCVMCSEGEMSKEPDSSSCWPCPNDQWPNKWRSGCVPKIIEFLSYDEPLGATLTATVILYIFMTVIVLCFFVKYRETPIIKANNRTLSYLILLALMMSFLCSFLFIGEPLPTTCFFRQPAFGIIFVICVSCVLAKTIIVVIAFNATKPNSNIRRWLSLWVPLITVSVCTVLQVVICATWLMLCPPFPVKEMKLKTGTIIFHCNECSETAFWCMMGYMGFLACVSFTVAFFARKLPDSFNEAKWITLSMLIFLSVWVSFFPGYLNTQGKYMVAVEVFGIIASSAGLLICIFVPKFYILFLKPEMNTKEHLLEGSSRRKREAKF